MADRRATYEELDRQLMASQVDRLSPRQTMSDRHDRHERERSRSISRHRESRRSYSRSPGRKSSRYGSSRRSYRSRSRDGGRSHGSSRRSRSPGSSRRRHLGNRVGKPIPENPGPSKCLGVFGLSLRTTERDLRDVFSRYGPIEECSVVIDAQTGRSRGFSFIYFESVEDAKAAKESCNGIEIDGRRIRVDFSITQRAHTPTPGIYMGKPGQSHGGNYGRRRRDDGFRGGNRERERRSPSPYYRQSRRRHSRSRSFSPRKYY